MRILLVHNFYGSTAPSGENKVFEAEKAMLEKHGEVVDVFTRHSDEIRLVVRGSWLVVGLRKVLNLIKGALCTIGNPFAARALAKKIRAFKPDVVHFHNQFPLISPLALWAAHRAGCKVVMTLHNYRTVCAAGIPMRDGHVCRECFRCRQVDRVEVEKWRRAQAEKKVGEWLAGVDEAAFEAALVKLVDENSAAGEYRFKRPEEKDLALDGARRFFREFSRMIVPLSDGRCVYFAPDPRARKRNVDNSVSWAEYAFHAVSSSGRLLEGSATRRERHYNHSKVGNLLEIERIVRSERGFYRLIDEHPENDAIIFVGVDRRGGRMEVVTRLDEYGNADANPGEVAVIVRRKSKKEIPPPDNRPLTEVVEAVAKHQAAGFSPSTTNNSVANSAESRKGELSVLPAIRHRCYRGSLLATLPLAINIWLYRKCWAKWVDRFIVLSEFQRDRMIECGFPASKLVVKGNFVSSIPTPYSLLPNPSPRPNPSQRAGVVYVGRLSDEKGVKTLIEAWRILGSNCQLPTANYQLAIVGDGDKRAEYEKLAAGLNIRFLGQKSHDEVVRLMAESKATVLPSECWETFGLTVVEGMLVGTPAIVSDLGALPSVVGWGKGVGIRELGSRGKECCGEVFEAGNAEALAVAIRRMLTRPDYDKLCAAAKKCAEEHFSEEANYRQLMEIYGA